MIGFVVAMTIEAPVYLDANVLIYAMETDGENGLFARRWLMQVDRGKLAGITSELTFAEVLPHPLGQRNDVLVGGYMRLLSGETRLRVLPVDRRILLEAADVRAKLRSETPDAIHVATALNATCRGFVTNDARLKLPDGIARHALADVMGLY